MIGLMPRRRPPIPKSIELPSAWRVRVLPLAIAVLLIVLVVCRRSPPAPTPGGDYARYHDHTFRVARVVDGDTLDVEAPDNDKPVTRIRLWGVDAPEIGHHGRPVMHFGPEAKDFTERTLSGRDVHIVLSPKRTRGKYGRLLAYVYLQRAGRMFNEMLLEEGYAYADLRFPHHYDDQFEASEMRARRSGAGLWADVTLDKMPAWKQRFERPDGKMGD